MRRIASKYARPGMVLGRAVYDSSGLLVYQRNTTLDENNLSHLMAYGVGEILIEDPRVDDVPVQPLIAPELEGEAIQALRQLMAEGQGKGNIERSLLEDAAKPIYAMTRNLFPDVMGEPNASGCLSLDAFNYVQPVKAAGLALLIGKRLGYGLVELADLGIAALLMNIGYLKLPSKTIHDTESLNEEEAREFHRHSRYGYEILTEQARFGPAVAEAVLQHHERWDGLGIPSGIKGSDICTFARILCIADAYYDLVSSRPCRKALIPHEAVEFIMAYSDEFFDPELVQIFARQVPLYPTGVSVKLNTGEVCIVSDANLGHVGRPVVRVCYDENQTAVNSPYDVDLSRIENQSRLVVQVLEY
ncbi:MAG: HD domain-containing phosphohydrolase [Dehalococcoidia bacterium]